MKYILYNDFLSFFKKYKKYVCIYYTIILLVPIVQLFCGIPISLSLFLDIVGLNSDISSGIISILMFFLNLVFHLLIAFQIFDNDIKKGQENIFLRMSGEKWIIYKIVSLIIINTIVRLTTYIIIYTEFKIFNSIFFINIVYYFFINLMFVMFLNLIFINIYAFVKKNLKYKYLMLFFLLLILVQMQNIGLLKISIFIYILMNAILSFIFYIMVKNNVASMIN